MRKNIRKAATLKYDQESGAAPIVSAAGKGYVADEILKIAKGNNIPVVEDPSLVEILAELNINEYIPAELYQAVAEVFAFIYHTDKNSL